MSLSLPTTGETELVVDYGTVLRWYSDHFRWGSLDLAEPEKTEFEGYEKKLCEQEAEAKRHTVPSKDSEFLQSDIEDELMCFIKYFDWVRYQPLRFDVKALARLVLRSMREGRSTKDIFDDMRSFLGCPSPACARKGQ